MRTKLWKCSTEQVRAATRVEAQGAELADTAEFRSLQEQVKNPGRRIGALDVTQEGPPSEEAWDTAGPRAEEAGG
eukprot:3859134-Pyramimonas_sp.AAC.1